MAEERGAAAVTLRRLYWDITLSWHPAKLHMLRTVVGISHVRLGYHYLYLRRNLAVRVVTRSRQTAYWISKRGAQYSQATLLDFSGPLHYSWRRGPAASRQKANMSFLEGRMAHINLSSVEIADRLAIRELIDAYAHCADRRDIEGQMSLFTADAEFLVFMDSRSDDPSQKINGREGLRPVFENLNTYETTTHFNGQSTVTWEQKTAMGILILPRPSCEGRWFQPDLDDRLNSIPG